MRLSEMLSLLMVLTLLTCCYGFPMKCHNNYTLERFETGSPSEPPLKKIVRMDNKIVNITDFLVFDVEVPALWFAVKFSQVYLFWGYIIEMESGNLHSSLSYRYNNQRAFTVYEKRDVMEIFIAKNKSTLHPITNPFIASEVRIYIYKSSFKFQPYTKFRSGFEVNNAVQHESAHYYIASEELHYTISDYVKIFMDNFFTITGIIFNFKEGNGFFQFCIAYEKDEFFVEYKDNVIDPSATTFFSSSKTIHLKPFVAKTVKLSCYGSLHLLGRPLILKLFGPQSHESLHKWTFSEKYRKKLDENGGYVYEDQSGCEPLYGFINPPSSQLKFLRSNYIGTDCFTQPDLCDFGFSVGLTIKDSFINWKIVCGVLMTENGLITGTGFIVYHSVTAIKVHVQTQQKIYTLSYQHTSSSSISSYIITWKKDTSLQLYKNGKLVRNSQIQRKSGNIPMVSNAFFKVVSGNTGKFYKIELWRLSLDATNIVEIDNIYDKIKFTGNQKPFGEGYLIPKCNSKNAICPNRGIVRIADKIVMGRSLLGSLTHQIMCPYPEMINGFKLRVEAENGDNTALNGIQLFCTKGRESGIITGFWGDWKDISFCNASHHDTTTDHVIGFNYKFTPPHNGDNTGGSDVKMKCSNGVELSGQGSQWGEWEANGYKKCPASSYLCGVQAKVQQRQNNGDDNAMTQIIFICCISRFSRVLMPFKSTSITVRDWDMKLRSNAVISGDQLHTDSFYPVYSSVNDTLSIVFPPPNFDVDNIEIYKIYLFIPMSFKMLRGNDKCLSISLVPHYFQHRLCFQIKDGYYFSDIQKVIHNGVSSFNFDGSLQIYIGGLMYKNDIPCHLDIYYHELQPDIYAVIPAEYDQKVRNVEVDLEEHIKCLSFEYRLYGEGFAYISILGCNADFCSDEEFLRIYRPLKGQWKKVILERKSYKRIRVYPLRNALGKGRLEFRNLIMKVSPCGAPNLSPVKKAGHLLAKILIPFETNQNAETDLSIQPLLSTVNPIQQTFFQGYDYMYYRLAEYMFYGPFDYMQFTMAGWFQYGNSSLFFEKDSEMFLQIDFSSKIKFIIEDSGENIYNLRNAVVGQWYHVVIQYTGKAVTIFIDMKLAMIYSGSFRTIPLKTKMKTAKIICFQWYDYLLDSVELRQIQLCPDKHSSNACAVTSECKICNQFTGKLEFLSSVSSLIKDDCTLGENFGPSISRSYYALDYLVDGKMVDSHDVLNTVTIDPSQGIVKKCVFGNGLCIKQNSDVFLRAPESDICDNGDCGVMFWIKYNCETFSDAIVFQILKFVLICNPSKDGRERSISVQYLNKNYIISSINNLWHYMSIIVEKDKEVHIFVDAVKVSIIKSVDANDNQGNSETATNTYSICLDELALRVYSKLSGQAEIYDIQMESLSDPTMSEDKAQKVLIPYVLHALIFEKYKPRKNKSIEAERQQYISKQSNTWITQIKKITESIAEVGSVKYGGELFYDWKRESLFAKILFFVKTMDDEVMKKLLDIKSPQVRGMEDLTLDDCWDEVELCSHIQDCDTEPLLVKQACRYTCNLCPKGIILQCTPSYPYAYNNGLGCCKRNKNCAAEKFSFANECCDEFQTCPHPPCTDFDGEPLGNMHDIIFSSKWSSYNYVEVNETYRIIDWNEGLAPVTNQPITKIRVIVTSEEGRVVNDHQRTKNILLDNLNQSIYYDICIEPIPIRGSATSSRIATCSNGSPPPIVENYKVYSNGSFNVIEVSLTEPAQSIPRWGGIKKSYKIFWKSTNEIPDYQLDDDPNTWNISSFQSMELEKVGTHNNFSISTTPPYLLFAVVIQMVDRYGEGIRTVKFIHSCPQAETNVISNITLIKVNETSVSMDIYKRLPPPSCGLHPYIITILIRYGEDAPDIDKLLNMSSTVVPIGGNYRSDDEVLRVNIYNVSAVNDTTGFIMNVTLTELSPYTNYSVLVYYCDDITCGNASTPFYFQSGEDIPVCSPANVTLRNTSSTSLIAEWEYLTKNCSMGVIITYNVTLYRRYNTTSENSTLLSPFEVFNLEKFEYVCIRMAASTKKGTGPYSEEVCCYTDYDAPDSIPSPIDIDVFLESINITLSIPDEYSLNGLLHSVVVNIQAVDMYVLINGTTFSSDVEDMVLEKINSSVYREELYPVNHTQYFKENISLPLRLGNLSAFTFYVFNTAFITRGYIGNSTRFYVVRTLESVPDISPNITSVIGYDATSIAITWGNITESEINGILLGYRIFYNIFNATIDMKEMYEDVEDPLQYHYILRGLVRDAYYNISIAGYTSAGVGVRSGSITNTTGPYIDGNYTEWNLWSPCTVSCGGGTTTRSRTCTNPEPYNGGYNCTLPDVEEHSCNEEMCSGPFLTPLGDFNCDSICNNLNLICYHRHIITENTTVIFHELGVNCSADTEEKMWTMDYHPSYYPANHRCAGYVGVPANVSCNPKVTSRVDAQRICNCVSLGEIQYAPWASWSPCSQSCFTRTIQSLRTRRRICNGICNGKDTNSQSCQDVPHCPVDGMWGHWSGISPCNQSCNFGYRIRKRLCDSPPPLYGGMKCPGPSVDIYSACNLQPCPVHGGVSEWTSWNVCEEPCGESRSTRVRYCNNPEPRYRGRFCSEHLDDSRSCNLPPCPTIQIDYIIKFTEEKWNYRLFYINRPQATALTKKVQKNMLAANIDTHNINFVRVEKYRKGSVIAYITVEYKALRRDQVVTFFGTITKAKKVNNMSIGGFYARSPSIPCSPPENISYVVVDKTAVNITWDLAICNQTGHRMYIYYMEESVYTIKKSDWLIKGEEVQASWMILTDLKIAVKYKGYVMQSIKGLGNAPPGMEFAFQTYIAAPSGLPLYVTAKSTDPEEIYVEWVGIAQNLWNGELNGYKIKYKKYHDRKFEIKTIPVGFFSSTLTNLKPYTYYWIEVSAFNSAGEGPPEYVVEKTLESVPSITVPNIVIYTKQSASWWSLSWSPIPDDKVNGKLLGYRLTYFLSWRSGLIVGGELEKTVIDFDVYTFYYKVTNLVNYATYTVTLTGFTSVGDGPADEYYANTCNCEENLYTNWLQYPPYTELSGPKNLTGFFPSLVQEMIISICGKCKPYDKSILHYYITKTGEDPEKANQYDLRRSVSKHVDVSFPVYGQYDRITYNEGSIFVMMVPSPGCAIIVRNYQDQDLLLKKMIFGVMSVWPFLAVSYAIAIAAGFAIWMVDEMSYPGDYCKGITLKGIFVGFWFSFVTMTTMGYGDIVPRSIFAKSLSIIWILMGLVLNGIIVGFITTELTSLDEPAKHELYNTKTGVLVDSFEHQYAVKKNAVIDPDVAYRDINSVLDALAKKEIDIAFIKLFSLANYKEVLERKNFKLVKIVDTHSGYGLALGGLSTELVADVKGWILKKEAKIFDFIEKMEENLPYLVKPVAGKLAQDVFSSKSFGFNLSLRYISICIGIFVFLGILYEIYRCIRRRAKVKPQDAMDQALEGLRASVEKFKTTFTEKIEEMEQRHWKELVILVDKKKEYEKRCKMHGKQVVDRQLRISYAEAKRKAWVKAKRKEQLTKL